MIWISRVKCVCEQLELEVLSCVYHSWVTVHGELTGRGIDADKYCRIKFDIGSN